MKVDSEESFNKRPLKPKNRSPRINQKLKTFEKKTFSFINYLTDELTGAHYPLASEIRLAKERQVYELLRVPIQVEKLLFFGFFICLDSFLFTWSFLPIRFVSAIIYFILGLFAPSRFELSEIQKHDLLRGSIFILCTYALYQVFNFSFIYHQIRGQSVLKLYVIYNMLEVFDKLCNSFGRDIMDTLFLCSTPHPSEKRLSPFGHFLLAFSYVFIHSGVLFYQMVTLSVAINSHDGTALITLIISNQFVELKGNVFKKFSKENVFQISCSDIVERFQLFIFLLVVGIENFGARNWEFNDYWLNLFFWSVIQIICTELLVDWTKHAFISKFNSISPQDYLHFYDVLVVDIVSFHTKLMSSGNTSEVGRRIGFVSLPLACIIGKIFIEMVPLSGWRGLVLIFFFCLCLCCAKIFIHIQLLGSCLEQCSVDASSSSHSSSAPTSNSNKVPSPRIKNENVEITHSE